MKFAPNRLYIESYDKCPNCGVLLYERTVSGGGTVVSEGKIYCSDWCLEWQRDRIKRRQTES